MLDAGERQRRWRVRARRPTSAPACGRHRPRTHFRRSPLPRRRAVQFVNGNAVGVSAPAATSVHGRVAVAGIDAAHGIHRDPSDAVDRLEWQHRRGIGTRPLLHHMDRNAAPSVGIHATADDAVRVACGIHRHNIAAGRPKLGNGNTVWRSGPAANFTNCSSAGIDHPDGPASPRRGRHERTAATRLGCSDPAASFITRVVASGNPFSSSNWWRSARHTRCPPSRPPHPVGFRGR